MRYIDSALVFCGDGTTGTATKNTTTNIDYQMAASLVVNGAEMVYKDATFGDYVTLQVVDKDNLLGMGANTVLNEWVKKWYVDPADSRWRVLSEAGGTVPAGLYIRVKYTSVSETTDVSVSINYWLYKM